MPGVRHSPLAHEAAKVDIFQPLLMHFFTTNINLFRAISRIQHKQQNQYIAFHSRNTLKMPLVVPGINSGGDKSKTEEWTEKLVGKKIGESNDATVCCKIDFV
jgi:hypothetical protein